VHPRTRSERLAPAFDFGSLDGGCAWRSRLIQQRDDRFSKPLEDLQFGREIAGIRRRLRRIDEVQHDIRIVAHVAHRLLARPQRRLAPAIPDHRQEADDGPVERCKPPREARAVAEARRVPQA
jgi:hypothetical protein